MYDSIDINVIPIEPTYILLPEKHCYVKAVSAETECLCPQMTVYVMGASLGIVWIFKLMLVEDVALAWNSDFPALKLLQGLVLGIETFGGEVPFFFLSGKPRMWSVQIPLKNRFTDPNLSFKNSMYERQTTQYNIWFIQVHLLNIRN